MKNQKHAGPSKTAAATNDTSGVHATTARISRDIATIHVHLQAIRDVWAATLGVSGPQWMILVALRELDQGEGVPVNVVSKLLLVDSSFVTTQSKLLEKKGLVRRKTSQEDARVVRMSLTDRTCKHMSKLTAEQDSLNSFIFKELSESDLADFLDKLADLKLRFAKAATKIKMGL